jgi:dTDP-4-dehydrorhamnose reductase
MLASAVRQHPYFSDNAAPDVDKCDITNYDMLESFITTHRPKFLINCAAYTDVTRAETDMDIAMSINADGVKNIAFLSKKYGCKLVHISTDFIFRGDIDVVYDETRKPDPINKYGLSKLMGEKYALDICPDALILRVSWLYGAQGKNFVSTISDLMQNRPQLKIVSDQYGRTTYTVDVAVAIAKLLEREASGIYHFANAGVSSRYEFTLKIYEILRKKIDFECDILPIRSDEYSDKTPRPTWSVLGCDKYEATVGEKIRDYEDALVDFLDTNGVGKYDSGSS